MQTDYYKAERAVYEMGESGSNQVTEGLIDCGVKLGFYSEMRWNTEWSFKQMSDMIHLREDDSSFRVGKWIEDRMKSRRAG